MTNYGFVIDNRSCIGCHACTVACKSEHDIPIGVNRTHVKYIEKGTFPDSSREFSVHRCNHCEDAPCVTICPTTALFTRPDGIVDFDDARCIGCRSCMQACPYDALYIDPDQGTAAKCNYCVHRLENAYEPACVIVCPTEAIVSGDLDDPASKIAQLVASHDPTVRKPESGAKPNVFYIETSEEMLDPAATEHTGTGMWSEQVAGVGHFAKYAENRLGAADTDSLLVQLALEKKASEAQPRDQAIIRDVMAKLGDDSPKAKRSYDQPSKGILWGWEVSAYIMTKSMAAGFYIVAMLGVLLDYSVLVASNGVIIWVAASCIALLGLTGLLLVKDLDRPERFLYVLLRPNWESWLVRGAYILGAFGAVLTAHIGVELLELDASFHQSLAIVGIPLAWMTGAYTGWLFKQAKGRTIWASRSNFEISSIATLEMIAFALVPYSLVSYAFDKAEIQTPLALVAAALLLTFVYFAFKHINKGLQKAQMEPLL